MTLISYVPHSGFGNQIAALNNAIDAALAINATLLIPKLLHHHDLALGSCHIGILPTNRLASKYAQLKHRRLSIDKYIAVTEEVKTTTKEHVCAYSVNLDHACGWDPISLLQNKSFPSTTCIRLGSTFIMRRATNHSECRTRVQERWRQTVRERMINFTSWDVAHLRLKEGRSKGEKFTVFNTSDETPLVIITDDAKHAMRLVSNHTRRRIILSQSLFTSNMLETDRVILDVTIGILARKFYESNTRSWFSRFIQEQRRCSGARTTS